MIKCNVSFILLGPEVAWCWGGMIDKYGAAVTVNGRTGAAGARQETADVACLWDWQDRWVVG